MFIRYLALGYPDMAYDEYLTFQIHEYQMKHIHNCSTQFRHIIAHAAVRNFLSPTQKTHLTKHREWYEPLKPGTKQCLTDDQKIRLYEIQLWLVMHPGPRNTIITLRVIKDWFKNKRNVMKSQPKPVRPKSFRTKPKFKKRKPTLPAFLNPQQP